MSSKLNINQQVFFALLKAGLWGQTVRLSSFECISFSEVCQLAEEQAVVGPLAAGLEHVVDVKVSKKDLLSFIGGALQMEQRNKAMNSFIGELVDKMRESGIYAVLVKGQGIAQCYERPYWRTAGDIDFLLSKENYHKAKMLLTPLAQSVEEEDKNRLHLGMTIELWKVELHGTMKTAISKRVDRGIEDAQKSTLSGGEVRSWNNNGVAVFLPSANNDVIIVFTHFLKHFYVGGVGLRQICDWCRLLWTYRTEIDRKLLEKRLRAMGLMTEWKAFAAFSVKWLGMPEEAMPFYDGTKKENRKADKICRLILEAGNFGHNKDTSYRSKYSGLKRKIISFWRLFGESLKIVPVFPGNAPKFFVNYVFSRLRA